VAKNPPGSSKGTDCIDGGDPGVFIMDGGKWIQSAASAHSTPHLATARDTETTAAAYSICSLMAGKKNSLSPTPIYVRITVNNVKINNNSNNFPF
jgi:hypothetical protein